uniref:Tf2-1-like SH3-like domain-containing protein n=1 Tax=Nicotiana tabacum TaxID=4097 RepID=A0A1S4DRX9_TOBAC|nr:PREDICTED: uncharacterized protein LOC107832796 [Nicotiana tabacum]
MTAVIPFGKKGTLIPRFIFPFEMLEKVGEVAFRLVLPPSLLEVHPIFHVSMLRKYHKDRSHVLDFITVQLDENLPYKEEPVAILDRSRICETMLAFAKMGWGRAVCFFKVCVLLED